MRIKAGYVVALVLIVAVVLASPLLVGLYFKQNYYRMIQARSANFGQPIEITEYNLGWLSSTATITIKSPSDPRFKITVDQVITHGPMIKDLDSGDYKFAQATILSHIHLDKQYESFLLGGTNSENGVMGIFTWVSFLEHFKNHFQSAPFSIKIPNEPDAKITWAGISGDIETDFKHNFALENFKTSLVSAALYIQNQDHNVQLSPQSIDGEGNCGEYLFCVGHSQLTIPLINISSASTNARITNIAYHVESAIDAKDNFSGKLDFSFNKYDVQDYNVGPLTFIVSVNNVNAVSLHKMIVAMRDAQKSAQDNPKAASLILFGQLSAEVPNLIAPGFALDQNLRMATSYGPFNASVNLSWPKGTPLPKIINDLMQAKLKIHATAATTLVDQIIMSTDQHNAEKASDNMPAPISSTTSPGSAPQSFDEMLSPLMGQGLTTDEIKNIIALSQKNVPADAFNTYIDGRIAIRKIPVALGPILKKDYVIVLNTPFQNVAANAGANKQLDVWVRENKITSDTRAALIQLQKQGLSSEIYNASIDDIVSNKRLPSDLGEQLKNQNASTNPESSLGGGEDVVAATPASTADQGGELRKQFDAELQQGFIIQNKDSYVIDIDYEHGELKVNGKAVPVPSPF